MVDAWLIILTIVVTIIMIGLNIYLFAMYCHPDDLSSGTAWWSRIIVIIGSAIAWGFILLIPLDVANSRGDGGGMNINLFYIIMFAVYFIYLVFVLPMTLFLYESDDEISFVSRVCTAFCYEIVILAVVIVLALIAWGAFKKVDYADIEVQTIAGLSLSESIVNGIGI